MADFDLENQINYGINMLEASAGTGKTYTISHMVKRLVTGENVPECENSKPRSIENILIVTFTNAATDELRDRIRKDLNEYHDELSSSNPEDTRIVSLRHAITSFDQAQIFTIDGFCQRILSENAFETGNSFTANLEVDSSLFFQQLTEDFYRKYVCGLSDPFISSIINQAKINMSFIRKNIKGVSSLKRTILIDDLQNYSAKEIEEYWEQRSSAVNDLLSKLHAVGNDGIDACIKYIQEQKEKGNAKGNRKFVIHNASICRSLALFKETELSISPGNLEPLIIIKKSNWDGDTIFKKDNRNELYEDFEIFDIIEDYANLLEENGDGETLVSDKFKHSWIAKINLFVKEEEVNRKVRDNVMHFSDLQNRLYERLVEKNDENLIQHLRGKYSIALVDEFQDTNIKQYKIFETIFDNAPQSLYMIGDPKQAIYSFRGGDIFNYLNAKKNAEDRVYTLKNNYRSSLEMIQATNHLFGNTGENPFIHSEHGINFYETSKGNNNENENKLPDIDCGLYFRFLTNDSKNPDDTNNLSKDESMLGIYNNVIDEIHALLQDKKVNPEDIAILTRDNKQANEFVQKLAALNIPAVSSLKQSIFETEEATEIRHLMNCVLNPNKGGYLKAVLCGKFFNYNYIDLHELDQNEEEKQRWIANIRAWKEQWQEKGFIVMLRNVMRSKSCLNRLLINSHNGVRSLTNLFHIAERIHAEATEKHLGPSELLYWLMKNIDEPPKDENLRLDKDDKAVKVMTLHSSKGLEFPIVFCPFNWIRRIKSPTELLYHQEDGTPVIDYNKDKSKTALHRKEELAEDMRLLYVAITRAKYSCYLYWGNIHYGGANKKPDTTDNSPVGHLLGLSEFGGNEPDGEPINRLETVNQFLKECSDIKIETFQTDNGAKNHEPYQREQDNCELVTAEFDKIIEKQRLLQSFSSLSFHKKHIESNIDDRDRDIDKILDDQSLAEQDRVHSKEQYNIFNFPKGIKAGNFFHDVLENISSFGNYENELDALLEKSLKAKQFDINYKPCIRESISNIMEQELIPSDPFCLKDIEDHKKFPELEFYYPLKKFQTQDLMPAFSGVDTENWNLSKEIDHLDIDVNEGYMKGFIDLTFEYNGKFYILDWKSNSLGDSVDHYNQDAMKESMKSHSYYLQYHIYALALHLYLRNQMKDSGYNYDTHFGGAFYIFLRGVDKNSQNGVFFDRPTKDTILRLEEIMIR